MTLTDVINQINAFITANGSNAITADVLRPILLGMIQQPNDLTGELDDLTTTETSNLVAALNEVNAALGDLIGLTIHTGADTPVVAPPVSFNIGDFYAQEVASVVVSFWQYTGVEWVNIKNIIDDASTSLESTWSSEKIQEAINERDGFISLGNVVYTNSDATIPAGAEWRIAGVVYTNPAQVVVGINPATAGNYRTDILVGNTSNTFEIIEGVEGTGTVVAPQTPASKVLASEINIYGASVVSTGPGGGFVNVVGYFDYNDLNTQTTPIALASGIPSKLTNDTAGPYTVLDRGPYGVSTIWDTTANTFNFAQLSLGDTIDIRLDIDVTTTSPSQNVKVYLRLGEGSPSQYDINFIDRDYKSSGSHKITDFSSIYIEYEDIRDYPAAFYIETDDAGSVKVNGWYSRIIRAGVNVYTLEVSDEAYVKKDFAQGYAYPDTGSGVVLPLRPEGFSNIVLTGSGLLSVEGFNLNLITGVPGAQIPYAGKPLRIYNSTGADVTLVHNGTGPIPFIFRSEADIVIPTGEYLYLDYDISGVVDTLKSWSDGGGEAVTQYPKVVLHANQIDDFIPLHTGVVGGTVIQSFTIPANTVPENCTLRLSMNASFSKSANYKFFYLYLNGTNQNYHSIINYAAIGTNNNSNTRAPFTRDMPIIDGFIYTNYTAHNYADGLSIEIARVFDVTVDNVFYFAVNLVDISDWVQLRTINFEVLK